ncbi:hypothetical protein [Pseudoalteromonas umbrosa]|uniref:hypothetical protein n=1 Tax=Pseudoalteromonas umbrosa TaxID=3048489 RepID=UPI0024C3DBC1|nr:hypothetical protein [Pseudoalteromonas sp. B95]MDK1285767.1 hypothetical protein [Pseudoalteromonas sp. B95]
MLKHLSHIFVIAAVLVAFVGQSLAYNFVMSYEQGSVLVSDMHTPASNSLDTAKQNAQSEDDCCEVDCCEDECICPANACMTFAYVKPDNQPVLLSKYHHLAHAIAHQHPIDMKDLLFRPPIFTS